MLCWEAYVLFVRRLLDLLPFLSMLSSLLPFCFSFPLILVVSAEKESRVVLRFRQSRCFPTHFHTFYLSQSYYTDGGHFQSL